MAQKKVIEIDKTMAEHNQINPSEVIEQCLVRSFGLDKYQAIQSDLQKTNIFLDESFQKKYNAFYKVRRNSEWRNIYYELFEKLKKETSEISFRYILEYMYLRTGNIEASFSSKMLATLNPDFPIWDQYVLKNLGITLPTTKEKKSVDLIVEYYSQICDWYKKYIESDEGKKCVEVFNQTLSHYKWISPIKKIDFFLWGKR